MFNLKVSIFFHFLLTPIQDKSDDIEIGVKSTAILFGDQTKYWLSAFSAGMIASLAVAGITGHQSWPYFAGVGLTAAHLAWQVSENLGAHSSLQGDGCRLCAPPGSTL